MRDVSHQTAGAAALGLYTANRNMLGLFAQSIAKSRDWAAYWEIDSDGHPSSADYVSDADFWFNLPANFDVLDAATRMWRWTGNDSYRSDHAFQRFFGVTMTDYMRAWQLTPSTILTRPRIANQRQAEGRFVGSRGIPSYTEDSKDFIFGTDLLASEYRAIESFQEIASTNADRKLAQQMNPTAEAIQDLLERVAWSKTQQHYLGTIRKDLSGSGSGDALVLYFRSGERSRASSRRARLHFFAEVLEAHRHRGRKLSSPDALPLRQNRCGVPDTRRPQQPAEKAS